VIVLILTLALTVGQAPAAEPVDTVTLVPADGTTLTMGRGGYEGHLEISAYPGGLAAVETTTIDRYLAGISEVPASWPAETLAAQAVAARTYLAWTLYRGRTSQGDKYEYDICASQFCQVYRGPGGAAEDWSSAVARTGGEILVYDDRPAQALYSSSAGSRTRAVQDVFGGGATPYLQPVDSPELSVTPYRDWELIVSADAFVRIFERGGYNFGDSITAVVIRSDGEGEGQVGVEVHTEQGITVIPVTRFRAIFNVYGPDLYPGLMPAARPTGGRWPQTVLSYTFDVDYEPPTLIRKSLLPPGDAGKSGVLTVQGEGWGHGVGMSQWGAMAMGTAGESYQSILDLYYGLAPVDGADMLPDTVRVGLATEEAEIVVTADGPFELVTAESESITVGAGEWIFRQSGQGLVIVAPLGSVYDSPLLRYQRWRPR
jgi:stage II sporulation protein D